MLALLAQGLTNKEIAQRLVISPGTVRQHAYNLYQKLQVNNRQQAVARASDLGILISRVMPIKNFPPQNLAMAILAPPRRILEITQKYNTHL